jgi:hypothetical protein
MPFEPTSNRFDKSVKGCVGQILHVEPFVTSSQTMMFKVEQSLRIKWWDKDGGEGTIEIRPTLWEVKNVKAMAKLLSQNMVKSVKKIDLFRAGDKNAKKIKKAK